MGVAAGGTSGAPSHTVPQCVVDEESITPFSVINVGSVTERVVSNEAEVLCVVQVSLPTAFPCHVHPKERPDVFSGSSVRNTDPIQVGVVDTWVNEIVFSAVWTATRPARISSHSTMDSFISSH